MSSDVAIRAEGIGKRYMIRHEDPRMQTLAETLGSILRAPVKRFRELRGVDEQQERFWALREIDLRIDEGELVGLIGKNGAGKSTLLKILSKITTPTTGRAELHGSVRGLLEVGTGFHPELTGRENIFLNGAVLGIRRDEIRRRFDEIVQFAGVERFLDTPLKRYSSGMYVRLAFAVAAHLEPDILLVDEVLAVGDASFQKRCIDKITSISRSGRTVFVVSHNLQTIASLASRCILLESGRIRMDGPTDEVIDTYLESASEEATTSLRHREDRSGTGRVTFAAVRIESAGSEREGHAMTGNPLTLSFNLEPAEPANQVEVAVYVNGALGERLTTLSTFLTQSGLERIEGPTTIRCTIPRFPLTPGRYSLELICVVDGMISDQIQNAAILHVDPGDFHGSGTESQAGIGTFHLDHEWSIGDD